MFQQLLAWPEDCNSLSTNSNLEPGIVRALELFRHSRLEEMEALIYVKIPQDASGNYLFLLIYSLFWRNEKTRLLASCEYFLKCYHEPSHLHILVASLLSIVKGQYGEARQRLDHLSSVHSTDQLPLISLIRSCILVIQGQYEDAKYELSRYSNVLSLEATLLTARILKAQFSYNKAIELLDIAIKRAPNNLSLVIELLTILHAAKRGDRVLKDLNQAIKRFGSNTFLMSHLAPLKLLQREPGRALNASLKERAFNSISNTLSKASNLFVAYEHCGNSSWCVNVNGDSILPLELDTDFYANRCLQLASCGVTDLAVAQAELMLSHLSPLSKTPYKHFKSSTSRTLKVAWLTGDCTNHPVARFLMGIFSASSSCFLHDHTLISTINHHEFSWIERFDVIDNLKTHSFDESHSPQQRLSYLRSQQYDVAVDLSGWTGGNSLQLFKERIARVQVNYLGYFASTGLQDMDFWLGDAALFPNPCLEKHTEAVYRLPRPFIAWQPVPQMPEYHAVVSEPPQGPVRIGTFNHNRKFSDEILKIWANLLQRLPDAKLVFKANNSDDPFTKELLRRRLLRAKLDPKRIEWLPITKTAEEHLEQYSQLDISLDCYPNGGCTTTCEALWMGVPTVTLAGDSYVSRMSTAVLTAANLSRFVAHSADQYVDIVCREVSDLKTFRTNRYRWRELLRTSDLGNAHDLFKHLEDALTDMVSIKETVRTI